MSLDLSSTKYSKSSITDIALISKNNETLWYSKYQLSKVSPVFAAIFLGDSSVRELNIDYDTNIVSFMLDYAEGKKFTHKDVDIKSFLIDLYKISHYYNFSTLENYITDEILEYPITDEILVLFKTCNNKKYITAVENRMSNGELKRTNNDINSDMIEIYRHVLDVAQRIVWSIDENNDNLRVDHSKLVKIKEALSSIPGIKNGCDIGYFKYLQFYNINGKKLTIYDTRRNYYNHKKKNVNVFITQNNDCCFTPKNNYFYDTTGNISLLYLIDINGVVTHKHIGKNKIPITEEDKVILSQYHEVRY